MGGDASVPNGANMKAFEFLLKLSPRFLVKFINHVHPPLGSGGVYSVH